MPNICSLLTNKLSNRPRIPSNLHSESSAKKPKAERTNGAPAKGQKLLFAPSIKIIKAPSSTPENKMFLGNHNNVHHSPVPDDTQKGLEGRLGEESSCTAANDDGSDEAEGYEDDARDAESPGSKILGVHGEGVVVWDVILCNVSGDREGGV